jgi:hypothetical protein
MSKPLAKFTVADKQDFAGMVGDSIDELEAFQVPHPHPAIENVLTNLYRMRDRLRAVMQQ